MGQSGCGSDQFQLPEGLKAGYLFPEIARRVRISRPPTPKGSLIRLRIGDVTEPLRPPAAKR